MLKPRLPGLWLFSLKFWYMRIVSTSREQYIVVDDQFTLVFTRPFHSLSVPIPELYFLRLRKQKESMSIGHCRHPPWVIFPHSRNFHQRQQFVFQFQLQIPLLIIRLLCSWCDLYILLQEKNPLNNFARLKKLTELINCDRMTWEERKEFEESMDINSV